MKSKLREKFINEVQSGVDGARLIVAAVQLPTGAVETITNTEYIPEKIGYLLSAYNENFQLKANPSVKIVGYMIV